MIGKQVIHPIMHAKDLVIGVDSSTTSCKAIVWDRQGKLIAEGRGEHPMFMPRPTWHEQPAESWWNAAVQAINQAVQQINPQNLAAICISHQRETFVPVNEAGQSLCNAMVWLDERARDLLPIIDQQFGKARFHEITGKPLSSNLTIGKILWLASELATDYAPGVFENTYKFLDVHAFLTHKLTGFYKTGIGCADPFGLFDMHQQRWSDDLLNLIGVRMDQMPETVPHGTILGTVTPQAARISGLPEGLPVVAGIGDGQAAGLGVNICQVGEAFLNLGTCIVSGTFSEHFVTSQAFRTTNGGITFTYLLETVLLGGAYTVNWFTDTFLRSFTRLIPELQSFPSGTPTEDQTIPSMLFDNSLNAAAQQVPPGSQGLMLVPYWNTAMNPYWDAAASGLVIGWRGIHQPQHMYRAILEGTAFEQRLHTQGVEAALGRKTERYVAVGGGAHNALWCQIIADVTGRVVECARILEATALGAGILAASGAGLYPDVQQAAEGMAGRTGYPGGISNSFTPDPQHHAIYTRLFEDVYQHLYPAIRPWMNQLSALTT